jgi:peptidoglycan/xylan/chitin deacetylase (PgdA/CDA1 family)
MKKTIVLMYHNIGMPPRGTTFPGLYVTPRMFRFQMWYLKAAGFRVVPLKEILSFIQGEVPDENLAAITFDDGYQDFHDNAYPVLKAYDYPSTVFLVSDLVGKENRWDSVKVCARKKLIGWKTILKLKEERVTFGSHSKTHPFLSTLSPKDVTCEIKDSKSFLEEKLQLPVDFFCYPYGDYDNGVMDVLREAGYKGALTTRRGLVHRNDNPFEIRRSLIRNTTHPFLFMLRLHTNYEDRKRRVR